MNAPQQQFYDFIVTRVQEDKVAEAEALLEEGFAKQDNGTFDKAYIEGYAPRLVALLKPEAIEEVAGIMQQFGGQFS